MFDNFSFRFPFPSFFFLYRYRFFLNLTFLVGSFFPFFYRFFLFFLGRFLGRKRVFFLFYFLVFFYKCPALLTLGVAVTNPCQADKTQILDMIQVNLALYLNKWILLVSHQKKEKIELQKQTTLLTSSCFIGNCLRIFIYFILQ